MFPIYYYVGLLN